MLFRSVTSFARAISLGIMVKFSLIPPTISSSANVYLLKVLVAQYQIPSSRHPRADMKEPRAVETESSRGL